MDYEAFLKSKIVVASRAGFDVPVSDLHPGNKPHQNDAIRWGASLGRALIAMSFGLGKTRIQCELARLIHARTGKPFLVVCPLGVKHQFAVEDGPTLGMTWQYVRNDAELKAAPTPYLITNYERVRDGNISPKVIAERIRGVSLDIVRRLIERLTSDPEMTGEAELILDPFAGLFTVPYLAIQMGRRGYGIELSDEYYRAGVK